LELSDSTQTLVYKGEGMIDSDKIVLNGLGSLESKGYTF